MRKDPIVEEVRRARERHAATLRYDLDAICRNLKEEEHQGRRKVVSLPPRRAIRSEEVETLRDIHTAERQIAQGRGISQARARQRVRAASRK